MKSSNKQSNEDRFLNELSLSCDSGNSIIQIKTKETVRCLLSIRKGCCSKGKFFEWDISRGNKEITIDNYDDLCVKGDENTDLHAIIQDRIQEVTSGPVPSQTIYQVIVNPQYWFENNPLLSHQLLECAHVLPFGNTVLILITPDIDLPEINKGGIKVLDFLPPSPIELKESLDNILDSLSVKSIQESFDKKDLSPIYEGGSGMNKCDFELSVSEAITSNYKKTKKVSVNNIQNGVMKGKTELIKKSQVLELCPPEDIHSVGGLENLKEWIYKRKLCFSEEAREYGVSPPKGIVLVGTSGSGKSLVAKTIAGIFEVPLIKFSFSAVFDSLLGSSEKRIKSALDIVEQCAPATLLIDEIDKGAGSSSGSLDGGASSRVIGTLLSWLQDNKEPIFTVITANNIQHLPPELTRRGRFDAIFGVGLPNPIERLEVIKIHLSKRGYKDYFANKELSSMVRLSEGFAPAEIESSIIDSLVAGFSSGKRFNSGHVLQAMEVLIPMSVTYKDAVDRISGWCKVNAIPASKEYIDPIRKRRVRRLNS